MTQLAPLSDLRVLIADDDPGVRRLLAVLLERQGCAVECALDGADALAKIQQMNPDVVLLDLMMPHTSGFDVIERINEVAPALLRRIIVLTAASPKASAALDTRDLRRVMRKPFDITELLAEVAACGRQPQPRPREERPTLEG